MGAFARAVLFDKEHLADLLAAPRLPREWREMIEAR